MLAVDRLLLRLLVGATQVPPNLVGLMGTVIFLKAKTLKRGLRLGFRGLVHGSGAFGSRPVLVLRFVQPFYWAVALRRVRAADPRSGLQSLRLRITSAGL